MTHLQDETACMPLLPGPRLLVGPSHRCLISCTRLHTQEHLDSCRCEASGHTWEAGTVVAPCKLLPLFPNLITDKRSRRVQVTCRHHASLHYMVGGHIALYTCLNEYKMTRLNHAVMDYSCSAILTALILFFQQSFKIAVRICFAASTTVCFLFKAAAGNGCQDMLYLYVNLMVNKGKNHLSYT